MTSKKTVTSRGTTYAPGTTPGILKAQADKKKADSAVAAYAKKSAAVKKAAVLKAKSKK